MTHPGRCGALRRECLRASCRERFPNLATVENLPNGWTVAHCHRVILRDDIDRAIDAHGANR